MKMTRYRKDLLLAITLAVLLLLVAGIPQAHAQSAFNLSHLIPQQRTMAAAMPDGGGAAAAAVFPGMTKEEEEAFLARPRHWFRSVGAGGSPYTKPVALDAFAKVLSDDDEKHYRDAFALIDQGKLADASAAFAQVKDDVLAGHVRAGMLLASKQARYADLQDWMKKYADLPEAIDIYQRALKFKGGGELAKPNLSARFGGSAERADGSGCNAWDSDNLLSAVPQPRRAELAKRLKKSKPEDVIAWISSEKQVGHMDESAETAATFALADNLMHRGQSAKIWLSLKPLDPAKINVAGATSYALWVKGLIAWIQKDFPTAYGSFSKLVDVKELPGPNRAGAAFWAARASERLGKKEDALRFINVAAKYPRSFYGLLAISHNNDSPQYNWTMPSFTSGHADAMKKTAAGKRALALLQLDERTLAEAELRTLPLHENGGLLTGVMGLANRYGLPSLAMQAGSALGGEHTYDAALYPLLPWQPPQGYASDPALVLAVAKNESHFNHTALSPAGAKGLMQVMPKTAEHVKPGSSVNLYDPQVSVTLGDRYLDMLNRTDGVKDNLLLLIGSYNCGPDALVKLQAASVKENGDDSLLFIETLPIKETREYMQKVMATYWVYRARFNKPLTAMAELAIGRWPAYRPAENKLSASAVSY